MSLQIHQWYSLSTILVAFGDVEPDILCDGEFIVFPDTIICLSTVDANSLSHFETSTKFVWKPQRLDYAPTEPLPWFPEAARETEKADRSQPRKRHHLFVKTPADDDYYYLGPVHLSSYGFDGKKLSANFSLETALSRFSWLHFGGSLEPRHPFALLPFAEDASLDVIFHRKTIALLHISPPDSLTAATSLAQLERHHHFRLPASVREWYSLTGAMDVLSKISLIHQPADIVDYDKHLIQELIQKYATTPPFLHMLPTMFENQGVWHLAVVLNDEDDPPVMLGIQEDNCFEWHLHTQHFSDFVYAWSWDYVMQARDYIINVSDYLMEADIMRIQQKMPTQVSNYVADWYHTERYTNGNDEQRITLQFESQKIDIFFSAETIESLQALLRGPWSRGNLLDQMNDVDLEMQKMYLW